MSKGSLNQRLLCQNIQDCDHVRWNSEAGRVSGIMSKMITADTGVKGCRPRGSRSNQAFSLEIAF
jgi:hypothetical protein